MATIKPFKAIRPAKDKVHLVASRSVDNYKFSELNDKLSSNPYTFLHIIKPKMGQDDKSKLSPLLQLKKIKTTFNNFVSEGVFISDKQAAFYIYSQEKDNLTF